jgi:High potential iron-sulfur protein
MTANATRRTLIFGAGLVALAASTASAASSKLSPAMVSYQPRPKGKASCDNCVQWQPPKSCKVVSGDISPKGWCTIWAKG